MAELRGLGSKNPFERLLLPPRLLPLQLEWEGRGHCPRLQVGREEILHLVKYLCSHFRHLHVPHLLIPGRASSQVCLSHGSQLNYRHLELLNGTWV